MVECNSTCKTWLHKQIENFGKILYIYINNKFDFYYHEKQKTLS